MHGRLKHIIISSEAFQKKKWAKYDAQAEAKQTSKGKGIGKSSKEITYLGVSGKGRGKGKRPHRKIIKSKVTPLITKVTSRNNISLGSTTDI